MKVRHPPGRAARPWLAHRLAVARRGAELLDAKHLALMSERRRLEPLAAEARTSWDVAARRAERALTRAAMLGGERQVELARRQALASFADVTVRWRSILGVTCPQDAEVDFDALPGASALGGSAALLIAARIHQQALEAGLRFAVFAGALERVEAELRATALRRNAVEHRWIPAHESALADLEVALEELEREDGARVRWAVRRS